MRPSRAVTLSWRSVTQTGHRSPTTTELTADRSAQDPVDLVIGRLSARAHDHPVDVDVRRAGCDPGHTLSDVIRGQRLGHPGIHGVGLGLVTVEPGQREALRAHHARRDLAHPYRLVPQLEPQGVDDRAERELGGHVTTPTLVGDLTG